MESLLRWSIANTDPNAAPPSSERLKALDPEIIDHILGKPDAVLMREAAEVALDESKSEDERAQALEDLEMLVEHIDNANNMTPLKLWEPLINLLKSTPSSVLRTALLWIFGTAVQNNPKAQYDFLANSPIPLVLSCLDPSTSTDPGSRSKAVYTLAGTLKHSRRAVEAFGEEKGWAVLQRALKDPSLQVRRKTAFLISSLLLPSNTTSATPANQQDYINTAPFPNDPKPDPEAQDTVPLTLSALMDPAVTQSSQTLLETVISEFCSPTPHGPNGDGEPLHDPDLREKLARCLVNFVQVGGSIDADTKKRLGNSLKGDERSRLGLDDAEWALLFKN